MPVTIMTDCRRIHLISLLLQLPSAYAFARPVLSFRSPYRHALHATKSSKKQFPICLIATDQVVLPGESATIWTEEQHLIDDCVENYHGILALGVTMDDSEEMGSDNMLEIASLCEIKECEDDGGEEGMFVTVTCVGRVRLDRLQHSYPYFKFSCSKVNDDVGDMDKCNFIADNIEILMKKLSSRELELDMNDSYDDMSLLQRYRHAYGVALEADQVTKHESRDVQLLTAISWAAFTSVEDPELEHYRVKALDWEFLFERLKLAQYMLREKQLRLQGHAMKFEHTVVAEETCFSEGFQ
jgi:hypothetical protein